MSTKTLAMLVLALAIGPVYAQETSTQRARAYTALPDWSGYWETVAATAIATGDFSKLFRGPKPTVCAPPGTCSPPPLPPPASAPQPEVLLLGLYKLAGAPPYNPEWEERSRNTPKKVPQLVKDCAGSLDSASASFPIMMEDVFAETSMFQLLVTPEETLLLTQAGGMRHIFTDGRPHPKQEDLWPTDLGDSIGHWEGATLVIDTIARKAGPVVPNTVGFADLSAQAHFTERLTRIDADTLQDDMTIDDPQRFVHPWKILLRYDHVTGVDRMIPYDCAHDRSPIVNGQFAIAPP